MKLDEQEAVSVTHIDRRRSRECIISPSSSLNHIIILRDQAWDATILTGSAFGANSAPDSLTPKYLNLVRVAEQVEDVGTAEVVVVDGASMVDGDTVVLPESGKHCE